MSKLLLSITLLALAASLSACAPFRVGSVRVGNTAARTIAKQTSVPGKFVYGQCLTFANALHKDFKKAGVRSKVIAYRAEALTGRGPARDPKSSSWVNMSSNHAAVAYEDAGRVYVMDNQSYTPKWIQLASVAGMAQQFEGMNSMVSKAWVREESRAKTPRVNAPRIKSAVPQMAPPIREVRFQPLTAQL